MLRNSRFLLALVGQAPLLVNFIRAAAPKTPLKSRILLFYLRFCGNFSLRNYRIPYYVIPQPLWGVSIWNFSFKEF